ncbi:MAG: MucB/RseB C-terminal domain-containing protein [Gammaproteobacteria bacterium]|nr:MucB/RseB C-terminal domain-containing protein [Gammaproteobacteria bacterium]
MRALSVCAGVATAVVVHAAPAPVPAPTQLLLQAAEAARAADFQGVLLYRGDRVMEVLRVTHRYKDGHEDERIETLNGEPREMIRRDNQVVSILPRAGEYHSTFPREHHFTLGRPAVKGLLDRLSAQRLQMLVQWYAFHALGDARVAGRDCRGVSVVPKDRYRYGYRVWADAKTHVPLRVSLISDSDRLLEQAMFTEIEFPASIPDSMFRAQFDNSKFKAVAREVGPLPAPDQPVPAATPADFSFERLPPGFQVTLRDFRELPDGGRVQHILLSDGLSTVSVFAVPQSTEPTHGDFRGLSRIGAVEAYGRIVGNYHVTVIGEAPRVTVQMIGDQIRAGRLATPATAGTAP